jgi:hypothetical protein
VGGILGLFGGTFRIFLMINTSPHARFPERMESNMKIFELMILFLLLSPVIIGAQ